MIEAFNSLHCEVKKYLIFYVNQSAIQTLGSMALKLIKRALLTRAFTEAIINFLSQILVVALPFEKSKAAVKTTS